jgi:hypothetical protein
MLKGNEYETMFSLDLFIQMTFNQKIAEDLAKDQEILTFINAENKNEKMCLTYIHCKQSSKWSTQRWSPTFLNFQILTPFMNYLPFSNI